MSETKWEVFVTFDGKPAEGWQQTHKPTKREIKETKSTYPDPDKVEVTYSEAQAWSTTSQPASGSTC